MTTETPLQRSARKPRGDGYLRRAEILAAAEGILESEGYEAATIRKIADEVGVSSTALYIHFADKSSILLEISDGALQGLLERNTAIAAKPIDAAQRVRQMLEGYVRWGLAHPKAYELVFSNVRQLSNAEKGAVDADVMGAHCYDIFSGVVRELADAGRLRKGSADSNAHALWAACHGLVVLTITPSMPFPPIEELIEVTLDGIVQGLVTH